jgi:DNA (cytosine-5)-methyltransferase 1
MRRIPFDENHEFVRGTKWEVEGRGISLVYRRLHPLKPSYTIVAYGGGGTHGYHYDRDRATLTLREKARLQTFPDTFLFSGSKTEIRAQIGEAVPPLAAKRLAQALAEVLTILEE